MNPQDMKIQSALPEQVRDVRNELSFNTLPEIMQI
jgi:hypothetical protein